MMQHFASYSKELLSTRDSSKSKRKEKINTQVLQEQCNSCKL
jgi:hypothetical protein